MSLPLADLNAAVTGLGTLATMVAVISGVILNLRKRPSEELLSEINARKEEDAFYKGRLETSERELAEEEGKRRAAEERARSAEEMLAMRENDIVRLRSAKDADVHAARVDARIAEDGCAQALDRVDRLRIQVRELGADPVA